MVTQENENLLLRSIGMRRSGTHAVYGWLRGNLLYEDLTHNRRHNDVWTYGNLIPRRAPVWRLRVDPPAQGKGLLVVNFEDVPIQDLPKIPSFKHADRILDNAEIKTVFPLRDPFNGLASRLKAARENRISRSLIKRHTGLARIPIADAAQRWKEHAQEFIAIRDNKSNSLGSDVVLIDYNRWSRDKTYRDELLRVHFGQEENRDVGFNDVPANGGGSSSDGRDYHGRASEMKTDERWKKFEDDKEYRALFADRELAELSGEIFGNIPGTEQFLK